MEKEMMLNAYLRRENGKIIARSQLHDGTQFSLTVGEHDVIFNEDVSDGQEVTGFIFVTQMSAQDNRVYVRLPAPTIEYGKNILVHTLKLQPRNVRIEDFLMKDE